MLLYGEGNNAETNFDDFEYDSIKLAQYGQNIKKTSKLF